MAEAILTALTAEYTCEKGHTTTVTFNKDDTTKSGIVSTYETCEECD